LLLPYFLICIAVQLLLTGNLKKGSSYTIDISQVLYDIQHQSVSWEMSFYSTQQSLSFLATWLPG